MGKRKKVQLAEAIQQQDVTERTNTSDAQHDKADPGRNVNGLDRPAQCHGDEYGNRGFINLYRVGNGE